MIVDGLKHDELRLTRTAAESINLKLKPANTEYLGRLLEIGHIGRQSSKLLPLVFAWMQMCGQQIDDVDTHELSACNRGRTYRIEFGRPNLWHAVWYMKRSKKLKKIAFIAHLKKHEPNDILVFERGKNWESNRMEQRERERTRNRV